MGSGQLSDTLQASLVDDGDEVQIMQLGERNSSVEEEEMSYRPPVVDMMIDELVYFNIEWDCLLQLFPTSIKCSRQYTAASSFSNLR